MQYPYQVQIEGAALCNARCGFCPYSEMARPAKAQVMPLEAFRGLVAQMAGWEERPARFGPFLTSEPFADPLLFQRLAVVNELLPETRLFFYTNASLFTERRLADLAAIKNLEVIVLSLHHSQQAAYEAEIGLRWDAVLASIDRLRTWNEAGGYVERLELLRVSDRNPDGDTAFRQFCERRFPGLAVTTAYRYNWAGRIDSPWESGNDLDKHCPRHSTLNVRWDGAVPLCCLDNDATWALGNAFEKPLLDIYNGPVAVGYRSRTKGESTPCRSCNHPC